MVDTLGGITLDLQSDIIKNNRSTRLGSNPGHVLHRRALQPTALAGLFVHVIKQITYNGNKRIMPRKCARIQTGQGESAT